MNFSPLSVSLACLALAGFPAAGLAQSTTHCLPIGTNGAVGCQSSSAPTLTGGVVATGDIDIDYDPATGLLILTVENTSPAVSGEITPVITRLALNFPANAVTGATLVSQTPATGYSCFSLRFRSQQEISMGCLGDFNLRLSASTQYGLANAAGNIASGSSNAIGPVTFEIQLSGPGISSMDAQGIATTDSSGGNPSVAGAVKFQGGGVGGCESGWVSTGISACCPRPGTVTPTGAGCAPSGASIPALTAIDEPVPGNPFGVNIDSPSTPSGFALVVFGWSSTFDPYHQLPLPLDLGPFGFQGCSLNASTDFLIGVGLDGNGQGAYSFPLTPIIKWCDMEVTFQTFHFAQGTELLTSGGLTLRVGHGS